MSTQYLESLKKTLDKTKQWTPDLVAELVDELRNFFVTLRVKLESKDPDLRQAAEEDLRELRYVLEEHPIIRSVLKK